MMRTKKEAKFAFPHERPNFRPFSWKLDGGGRDLIISKIDELNITCMLEIGVLYGGSSLQWLRHKPSYTVIGVDLWEFDAEQVNYWWSHRYDYGINNLDKGGLSDEEFIQQLLRPDAAYNCTISNLWEFRERFIPVRGRSPAVLYDLYDAGYKPDLIYIDSDKEMVELPICNELWPNAALTGDDWTWALEKYPSVYPVQVAVQKFAAERSMLVSYDEATWCLAPT